MDNLVVLTLLTKNDEKIISTVLEYYIAAGFTNISIVDCGSTDNTINICNNIFKQYDISGSIINYVFNNNFAELFNFSVNNTMKLYPHVRFVLKLDIERALTGINHLFEFCIDNLDDNSECYYLKGYPYLIGDNALFRVNNKNVINYYYSGRIHSYISVNIAVSSKCINSNFCKWDELGG